MNDTNCVRGFMQATSPDQVARSQGDNLGSEFYRLLRARLVLSEALELCEGLGIGVAVGGMAVISDLDLDLVPTGVPNLVLIADACADLRYVVVGTEVAFGVPGDAVFAEVHRSNMTKLHPDGTADVDPGGKVLKPAHFDPADVAGVLASHAASELVES